MKRPAAPVALIPTRLAKAGADNWARFEDRCDTNEIRRLCERELDAGEYLEACTTWSDDWWHALHEYDKTRTALIRASRRIRGEGA